MTIRLVHPKYLSDTFRLGIEISKSAICIYVGFGMIIFHLRRNEFGAY